VIEEFDADAMLNAGEVPLGPVIRRARDLRPGQLVRVVSSFRPAPLSDKLTELGFRVRMDLQDDGAFHTHIGSAEGSGDA
jgi:hypothetical protein